MMDDVVSTVFHSNSSTTVDQADTTRALDKSIPHDVKYCARCDSCCSSCASGIKPTQKKEENRDTTLTVETRKEIFSNPNDGCVAKLVKLRRRRRCCSAKAVGCIGAASLKASSSSAKIMNREKRENALITTLRKCDQKSTQTLHQLKELYAGDRKLMSKEQHYLKVTQASWRKHKKETKTLAGQIVNTLTDMINFDQSVMNTNPNLCCIKICEKDGRPVIDELLSTVKSILADLRRSFEMLRDSELKETEKCSELVSISQKRQIEFDRLQNEESKLKNDFQKLKLLMADVEDVLTRWQSDLCFEISLKQERISCSAIKNFEFCVDKIVRLIDENEQQRNKAHHLNVELSNTQPLFVKWTSIKERIRAEIDRYRAIIVSFSEKSNSVEFGHQADGSSSFNVLFSKHNCSPSLFLVGSSTLRESNQSLPLTDEQIMFPIQSQMRTVVDFGRKKLDVVVIEIEKNRELKDAVDRLRRVLDQKLTEVDEKMIRHEKELTDEKNENVDLSSLMEDMKKKRIENHRRLNAQYSAADNKKKLLNKQKEQLNSEIIKLDSGRRDMQMSLQKMVNRHALIENDTQKEESKIAEKFNSVMNDKHFYDGQMSDLSKRVTDRSTTIAKLNDRISALSAGDCLKPGTASKLSKRRSKIRESCSKLRQFLEQHIENKNNVENDIEKLANEKIVVNRELGALSQSIDRARRFNGILLDRQTREESSLTALRADLSKLSRVYQLFQQQLYHEGKIHEKVVIPLELESTLTENDSLSAVSGVVSKIDNHTRNIEEKRQKPQPNLGKCRAFDDIRIHQNMQKNNGNGDRSRSLTDVQSMNASDTFHSIEHDMGDYFDDPAIHP